ncbi:hypothetical protein [Paraliobacillus ryukyuensis]|uniref:hypothetical protein n=1 Tax=Paraliobacillus ryukyuensis TaxID=200904 RepID=UPI0015C47CC2|nr:hypothetical protein [Paraliobacillus ryukyuensis]
MLTKNNWFVGDYRAININGKWRATKRDSKRSTDWLFLDENEYDNPSEALEKYI